MKNYTNEELENALQIICSTIRKCERLQPKIKEGTSQHALLKNRIKALNISKFLILNDDIKNIYTKEELITAIPPISSIIGKCETAQQSHIEGTTYYNQFQSIINAMKIVKSLMIDKIKE